MKTLVTGGAGFIGSHLVDFLVKSGDEVTVVDNLSSGSLSNLSRCVNSKNFNFIKSDLSLNKDLVIAMKGCETVFHFSGNTEVRGSLASPQDHFQQNIQALYYLLETIRLSDSVKELVFASSSTVYGEANLIPTPEDYGPLKPISLYGASKLAGESLISGYSYMYGFKSVIFRLGNIVGPRSNHGVIHDFLIKLGKDPRKLEILGDGTQSKSYLHIIDCISGLIIGLGAYNERVNILNLSSTDCLDIKNLVKIVINITSADNCVINFTGGVNKGGGWIGDVKKMQLNVEKLLNLGWKPKYNSYEAVKKATQELINK
ncbi:NAD-dependent epimerase/dehydratase family protein [Candidatus Bathyarchaeota archaeon]|nr:NAD-dependent epimerase/dehydratase family protein [Candidatus Bathyarchaeota archaeon]